MTEDNKLKEAMETAADQLTLAEQKVQAALAEEDLARHNFVVAYSKWVNDGRPE
jgi:hypothetical protein